MQNMTEKDGTPRDLAAEEASESLELPRRMGKIRYKILVLSGKGRMGKSTVAANLAVALAAGGRRVGLLDVDLHGPSIPRLLGIEGQALAVHEGALLPVEGGGGVKVMSLGLLLHSADDAFIWRGPLKMGVIKQLLKDVEWGALDYLIVDSPPGTGDEPLSIAQLLTPPAGAVVVTQPQQLSVADVRRSIRFCQRLGMAGLGVVENMSGFVCPHCGAEVEIFSAGGGERLALELGVPFLGRIPLDPRVVQSGDEGRPFAAYLAETEVAQAFAAVVQRLISATEGRLSEEDSNPHKSPS